MILISCNPASCLAALSSLVQRRDIHLKRQLLQLHRHIDGIEGHIRWNVN